MIEIAVLASGRGSNFAAIEEAIEQEKINGEIRVVLSDKENAGALVKAEAKGIKNNGLIRKLTATRMLTNKRFWMKSASAI